MSRRRCLIRMLRSLLAGCFFVLYGLGSLAIGGLLFPPMFLAHQLVRCMKRKQRAHVHNKAMRRLVLFSWKLFVLGGRFTGLFRVEISEEDRALLASTRGCVVVANHLTLIDVILLAVFLPDATAVAKAAARGNFFYSLIVKEVFLVNDDPVKVLDDAKMFLREGVNIIVFPQGTRTPAGTKTPLRRGAAQIARNAGVPIVPVVITCDPPVLAKGQPWHDVADRTIVWTLKVREMIPSSLGDGLHAHAAAVAVTEMIRSRLEVRFVK